MTTKDKVEKLEESLNVEALEVNAFKTKFQVYPWLKGRLFHKIITGNELLHKKNARLYWRQFRSIFYGMHNFFKRYDIWAFSSSLERRPIDGKYFDKSFDYIGNELGYKMLLIELRVYNYFSYRKIASKRAISKSFFMFFEEVYGRLFIRKATINDKNLLEDILSHVSDGIDHKTIIRKYLAQYKLMKFWLKVLRKPKVVLLSVSYTNFGYIRAFKENNIKVIEIQHGIISKNHHAYFYKKEFDPIQFPDIILSVGEKEKEIFDGENSFPTKNIIPVGSYIIDHYSSKENYVTKETPNILFTLQDGQIGDKFIEFILHLQEVAGKNFKIIIQPRRLTKEHYVKVYPELRSIAFAKEDFYSSMLKCDIHSTVYSTTAIEALSFGVPNILVNIDNQSVEQLGAAIGDNPYTSIVQTAEEFIDVFKARNFVDKEKVKQSNEQNIKPGYKVNVEKFLKELLNE